MFFTETRVTVELRSVNGRGRKTWVAAFHLSQILAFERSVTMTLTTPNSLTCVKAGTALQV
jgi:hypothetical protein